MAAGTTNTNEADPYGFMLDGDDDEDDNAGSGAVVASGQSTAEPAQAMSGSAVIPNSMFDWGGGGWQSFIQLDKYNYRYTS